MKILVVSNMYPDEKHPSYGVFVKNFCNQLGILGISYDLAVMYKGDNALSKLINYCTFYVNAFLKCIFGKYDVVYVHYASHSSVPVLFANKIKKNVIYTNVHGSDVVPENAKQEKMQHYTEEILECSEKIIVPSEYFKNYIVDKYGLLNDSIYIVHSGGVNSEVFYVESEKTHDEEMFKLGYVGRISHGKGWDTMIKACAQLKDIDYKLIIVGSGPKENDLEQMISEYNMEKYIERYQLLSQEDLRRIYNQLDVFLFPTEREGESLGLVAIEAMACGTPVIASDYAAPSDYIVNEINGLKFEMGNVTEFAEAIRTFGHYPIEIRKQMSLNARKTAEEYSVEKILKQMKMVFEE